MYEAIALSGGGYKGLSHLGALAYLEDNGILDCVTTVSGSSAGSIVAAMVALSSGPGRARELFRKYAERDMLRPFRCNNPFKKYGIVTPAFDDLQSEITQKLGRPEATLNDLYLVTRKRLIISALDVLDGTTRYFGADASTFDVPLMDALRASSAIPIIMSPVSIRNRLYVDGAITAYIPTEPLRHIEPGRVIGVALSPRMPEEIRIRNAVDFLEALATAVLRSANANNSVHMDRICYVDCDDEKLRFGLVRPDVDQAHDLFFAGYVAMRDRHMADMQHNLCENN